MCSFFPEKIKFTYNKDQKVTIQMPTLKISKFCTYSVLDKRKKAFDFSKALFLLVARGGTIPRPPDYEPIFINKINT